MATDIVIRNYLPSMWQALSEGFATDVARTCAQYSGCNQLFSQKRSRWKKQKQIDGIPAISKHKVVTKVEILSKMSWDEVQRIPHKNNLIHLVHLTVKQLGCYCLYNPPFHVIIINLHRN